MVMPMPPLPLSHTSHVIPSHPDLPSHYNFAPPPLLQVPSTTPNPPLAIVAPHYPPHLTLRCRPVAAANIPAVAQCRPVSPSPISAPSPFIPVPIPTGCRPGAPVPECLPGTLVPPGTPARRPAETWTAAPLTRYYRPPLVT